MTHEPPVVLPAARYNESEAARLLGVTKRTMMRWRAGRLIRPCHSGTRVWYKGSEITKFWLNH